MDLLNRKVGDSSKELQKRNLTEVGLIVGRVISAAFIKCYERPDTMHTTGCRTLMVDTAGCLETVKLILPATLSGIPPPKMSELASGKEVLLITATTSLGR